MKLKKVPVTVITGFLGAGKTTLVHNLLKNPQGKRIAVVVNEFGETGIDGELIKVSCECPEEDLVELSNGCLCCTVQEEFLPTMLKLMERKDNIDHIVIETSGLALPKPLVKAVNWPDLKPHLTVDAVVTVVDAVGMATGEICDRAKVKAQREADDTLDHETSIEELFEDQLNCADMVLISKQDLVEKSKLEEITNIISDMMPNRQAKIIPIEQGQISPEVLLGLNSKTEDDIHNRHSHHDHHHHGHHDDHHDHEHNDSIQSISIRIDVPHTPNSLQQVLEEMVQKYKIYRVKGFIYVPNKPMRMVIQGVGNRFNKYFDRKWQENEIKQTRLVIIGEEVEHLDLETFIKNHLAVCI